MLLKNENAIIYGTGGSIGGAVARAFAREGATVCLLILGIVIATLMALAIAIADLASGGRPDPQRCAPQRPCSMVLGDFIPAMTHAGRTRIPTKTVGRPWT